MNTKYVVDTNVLVHWLLRPEGLAAKIVGSLLLELFIPFEAIHELQDHAIEWNKKNPNIDLRDFIGGISSFVDIVYPPYDFECFQAASQMLGAKDPDDIPFLTVADEASGYLVV